jgi:hypothetical protein
MLSEKFNHEPHERKKNFTANIANYHKYMETKQGKQIPFFPHIHIWREECILPLFFENNFKNEPTLQVVWVRVTGHQPKAVSNTIAYHAITVYKT